MWARTWRRLAGLALVAMLASTSPSTFAASDGGAAVAGAYMVVRVDTATGELRLFWADRYGTPYRVVAPAGRR